MYFHVTMGGILRNSKKVVGSEIFPPTTFVMITNHFCQLYQPFLSIIPTFLIPVKFHYFCALPPVPTKKSPFNSIEAASYKQGHRGFPPLGQDP